MWKPYSERDFPITEDFDFLRPNNEYQALSKEKKNEEQ